MTLKETSDAFRISQRQRLEQREINVRTENEAAKSISDEWNDRNKKPKKTKNDPWRGAIPEYKKETVLPKRRVDVGSYLLIPDQTTDNGELIANGELIVKTKRLGKYDYTTFVNDFDVITLEGKKILEIGDFIYSGRNNFLVPSQSTVTATGLTLVERATAILSLETTLGSPPPSSVDKEYYTKYYSAGQFYATRKSNRKPPRASTFEAKIYLPDPANFQKIVTFNNGGDTAYRNNSMYLQMTAWFGGVTVIFIFIYNSDRFSLSDQYTLIIWILSQTEVNGNSDYFLAGQVNAVSSQYYTSHNNLTYINTGKFGPNIGPGAHDMAICMQDDLLFLFLDGEPIDLAFFRYPESYSIENPAELGGVIKTPMTINPQLFSDAASFSGGESAQIIEFAGSRQEGVGFRADARCLAYEDELQGDLVSDPINRVGFKNVRYTEGKCLYKKSYEPPTEITRFV